MATLSITVAPGDVNRVIHALCLAGGFDVSGIPATDMANALAAVKALIANTVQNVNMNQAQQVALSAVQPPLPVTFI